MAVYLVDRSLFTLPWWLSSIPEKGKTWDTGDKIYKKWIIVFFPTFLFEFSGFSAPVKSSLMKSEKGWHMSPGALWPERVRHAFVMKKVFYEIQLFDSGPGPKIPKKQSFPISFGLGFD